MPVPAAYHESQKPTDSTTSSKIKNGASMFVNFLRLLLPTVFCTVMLSPASGSIIIDDFTTGTFTDQIVAGSFNNHLDTGTSLGGFRRAVNFATPNIGSPNATTAVQNGTWSLTNSGGGIQVVALMWGRTGNHSSIPIDPTDPTLNLDLSQGDQFFEYDLEWADPNTSISLRVWSGVDEGNLRFGSSNISFPQGVTSPQTISINFSQFGQFSNSPDFTDIDGIALVLDFPTSDDFKLTEFRVGAAAVPEPSSTGVIFAMALAFASRRTRKLS